MSDTKRSDKVTPSRIGGCINPPIRSGSDYALFEAYIDKVPYTPLGAYLRLGETPREAEDSK